MGGLTVELIKDAGCCGLDEDEPLGSMCDDGGPKALYFTASSSHQWRSLPTSSSCLLSLALGATCAFWLLLRGGWHIGQWLAKAMYFFFLNRLAGSSVALHLRFLCMSPCILKGCWSNLGHWIASSNGDTKGVYTCMMLFVYCDLFIQAQGRLEQASLKDYGEMIGVELSVHAVFFKIRLGTLVAAAISNPTQLSTGLLII